MYMRSDDYIQVQQRGDGYTTQLKNLEFFRWITRRRHSDRLTRVVLSLFVFFLTFLLLFILVFVFVVFLFFVFDPIKRATRARRAMGPCTPNANSDAGGGASLLSYVYM